MAADRELRAFVVDLQQQLADWLVVCDAEDREADAAESLLPKRGGLSKVTQQ